MTPEELDALLAAAWMAGREEAARVAEDHECRHCEGSGYYDQGGNALLAVVHAAADIRSLPAPTPEQLKEIR